jgi:hypothetical protein
MASSSYSIGDEPSSDNYRAQYCDKCDADREEDCICIHACTFVCKECGHDHSHRPDFSGVKTYIDEIFPKDLNLDSNNTTTSSNNSKHQQLTARASAIGIKPIQSTAKLMEESA